MDAPPTISFGDELKDGFKPVNAWIGNGIAWLDDIQAFYRERAAIEKEYSGKLNALAKKYFEKKSKKSAGLSVGETPQMTPGSLESASLTTWTTILTAVESLAKEHETLSASLTTQVCDVLKAISSRYDDYKKRYESLSAKLLTERDSVYSELKKSKSGYDAECEKVEEKRAKIDKSFDSSKRKAENAYKLEKDEMNNVKNSYLIQIQVANRHKQKYFHEDVPEILNAMQDLNETRVTKLNTLWTLSCTLESTCHQNAVTSMSDTISEIARNLPHLDSAMFFQHNVGVWHEPNDFVFEPSPIWHDSGDIVVDEATSKIFLMNHLTKSRKMLQDVKVEVDKRKKEVDGLKRAREAVKLDESAAQKEIDLTRSLIYGQEELIPHVSRMTTFTVEVNTILAAAGDLERGSSTHNFKSTSFKIPTNCDLCNERIWGLSSKGFTCKDCGYTCHAKCEMKVSADCPGVLDKAAKKALKEEKRATLALNSSAEASELDASDGGAISRSNTSTSGVLGPQRTPSKLVKTPSTGTAASTTSPPTAPRNRVVAPPPERYIAPPPGPVAELSADSPTRAITERLSGTMLYAYTAAGDDEISVDSGVEVTIIEPDDGSGWIRIRAGFKSGLVPASYVEVSDSAPPIPPRPSSVQSSMSMGSIKKKGPAVKPKRGAKRVRHVVALYDYDARTDVEWSMKEGDKFVLVKEDAGDGWTEVEKGGEVRSVPANYVEIES
ncbi:Protein BZZ1 [Rhizina undulata]